MKRMMKIMFVFFLVFANIIILSDAKASEITSEYVFENSNLIFYTDFDSTSYNDPGTYQYADTFYYVKFVGKDEAKPNLPLGQSNVEFSEQGKFNLWNSITVQENLKSAILYQINGSWYLTDNDYFYMIKCDLNTYCELLNDKPIKIKKPELPNIGERYNYDFYGTEIIVQPLFHAPAAKVDLKVGKVTDSTVLNALAKKENGAYDKLLTYAKKDEGIGKFNSDIGINSGNLYMDILTDIENKLEDENYYYIYTNLYDPQENFRNVEDVVITQAIGNVLLFDVDYRDKIINQYVKQDTTNKNENKTEIKEPAAKEESKEENTVKNPNTGIYIGVGSLSLILISMLLMKKKNKFNNI